MKPLRPTPLNSITRLSKAIELLDQARTPLAEQLTRVMQPVQAIAATAQPWLTAANIAIAHRANAAQKSFAPYQTLLKHIQGPHFQAQARFAALELFKVIDRIQQLPGRQRQVAIIFAENGWYLDNNNMSFATGFELAEALEADQSKATRLLVEHFESRLDGIVGELALRHPHRGRFVQSAREAHVQRQYALSIPVLLTQADGICQDGLAGTQLYKHGGKKLLEKAKELSPDTLLDSLLAAVTTASPLVADKQQRTNHVGMLNRHAVIHGESLDYDTHINSLRAFSLVSFVSWLVDELRDQGSGSTQDVLDP